jgi:hypothetical protein
MKGEAGPKLTRPAISPSCYLRAGSLTSRDPCKNPLNLVFASMLAEIVSFSDFFPQGGRGTAANFQFKI